MKVILTPKLTNLTLEKLAGIAADVLLNELIWILAEPPLGIRLVPDVADGNIKPVV